jgi:hypothetical protein
MNYCGSIFYKRDGSFSFGGRNPSSMFRCQLEFRSHLGLMLHASSLIFKASKRSYNEGQAAGLEVFIYQNNGL